MSAAQAWRQSHHLQTRGRVGGFYDHLAAKVVGGVVNGSVHDGSRPQFGDVSNSSIGLCVESKASSGGGHHWRLSRPQMGRYGDARPLLSYVYFLASYKSRKRRAQDEKKRRGRKDETYSMLARLTRKSDQFEFLAKQTDEVWLLDLEFVQALEDAGIGQLKANGGFGNGRPDYELQRGELRLFQVFSDSSTKKLGVNVSGRWIFRRYQLTQRFIVHGASGQNSSQFANHKKEFVVEMSFPLYSILAPELDRKLDPVIRRNDDSDMPF